MKNAKLQLFLSIGLSVLLFGLVGFSFVQNTEDSNDNPKNRLSYDNQAIEYNNNHLTFKETNYNELIQSNVYYDENNYDNKAKNIKTDNSDEAVAKENSEVLSSHENTNNFNIPNVSGNFGGIVLNTQNCNCIKTNDDRGDFFWPYGKLITVGPPRGGNYMIIESNVIFNFSGLFGFGLTKIYEHKKISRDHWVLGDVSGINIAGQGITPISIPCYQVSGVQTVIGIALGDASVQCKNNPEGTGAMVNKIGTSDIPAQQTPGLSF